MILDSTDAKAVTTSENYIDVRHEYYGLPDEEGQRLKTTDVWYAVKPSLPEYSIVDYKDQDVPGNDIRVNTAWSLHKAGMSSIHIIDRDDIAGLRHLLNELEKDMDRRDMEALHEEFKLDNEDESE